MEGLQLSSFILYFYIVNKTSNFMLYFSACSQQADIIEDLVTDVPLEFDFLFSRSHVEVISGKQEGELNRLVYPADSGTL